MNKLTLGEVEEFISEGGNFSPIGIARQLADLMRENQRLHDLMKDAIEELEFDIQEKYSSTMHYPNEKRRYDRDMGSLQKYRDALISNKESYVICPARNLDGHAWDTSISGDRKCCACGISSKA